MGSVTDQLRELNADIKNVGSDESKAKLLSLQFSLMQLHYAIGCKTLDLLLLTSKHAAFLCAALVASVGLWSKGKPESWFTVATVLVLVLSIFVSVGVYLASTLLHSGLHEIIDKKHGMDDSEHKSVSQLLIFSVVAQVILTAAGTLGFLWVYLFT